MQVKSDEEILYDCYLEMGARHEVKDSQVSKQHDREALNEIAPRISLLLMRLTENDMIPTCELKRDIDEAKSLFIRYSRIKGRNPEFVYKSLTNNINALMRAVGKKEAVMIKDLRNQEQCGEFIDIQNIFEKKGAIKSLEQLPAKSIVSDAIKEKKNPTGVESLYYITDTGQKYHREDCPYCRGRRLKGVTRKIADNLDLKPCRCLVFPDEEVRSENTFATAFIDESIHPVYWDEDGKKGKAGSFSYIISKGKLKKESQIREENIIAEGVDYIGEHEHIGKLTEAAIGKVLLMLLYDYDFYGNVIIYTDNKSVVKAWTKREKNLSLAKQFLSVRVVFIPREENKKADSLGRTRMLLDMPTDVYKEVVDNNRKYKTLEEQVESLSDQNNELSARLKATEASLNIYRKNNIKYYTDCMLDCMDKAWDILKEKVKWRK